MARAIGSEISFAAKIAAAWGTAVELGANDGILIRPSGFKRSRPILVDDSLGLFWSTDSDPGEIDASGEVSTYMRYTGLELLLAAAMGQHTIVHDTSDDSATATGGSSTTLEDTVTTFADDEHNGKYVHIVSGTGAGQARLITDTDAATDTITVSGFATTPDATSVYTISEENPLGETTHSLALTQDIDDIFLCAAFNLNVNIDEVPSAKVAGFTIRGQIGQALECNFQLIGSDRIPDSAVNTTGTMANVTFREQGNRVLMGHSAFLMNAAAGAALSSPTDLVYPKSFELSFQRSMRGVYGLGGSFDKIDEPSNDGLPTVTMKLEFARYTSAAFFNALDASTPYKMQMLFTGAQIGSGNDRTLKIELPNMKFADADVPLTEGILEHPVEMTCLSAAAAPSGMTVTNPFELELVNNHGGIPIQE